jgi:hypothetical protein
MQHDHLPRPGKSPQLSAEGNVDRFPIIVAEWPRNSRELVRIAIDRFNNRFTIDMRSWWQDTDGTFRPSRRGLTLAVEHLPKLADALDKALHRAETLGLVGPAARIKDRTAAERQRRYRQRRNGSNGHENVTRNDT